MAPAYLRFVKTPAHLSLLMLMIVSYLLGTAYPFKLVGTNHVEVATGNVRFSKSGILKSRGAPAWVADAIEQNELSIELTVRPFLSDQKGPARILTISKGPYERNLTIGQQGRDLVIRLRRGDFTPNGEPQFEADGVFADAGVKRITVAIRDQTLDVRVDGTPVIEDQLLPRAPLARWNRSFPLALGNELTWDRPWLGEITSAQVTTASRRIDLLAPGVLAAPTSSKSLSFSLVLTIRDVLTNIGGFVLFGLLSIICLTRPSPLLVAAIWAPICIIGEAQQIFIESRYPSISDFIMNVGGAYVGAHFALFIARELATPARARQDE